MKVASDTYGRFIKIRNKDNTSGDKLSLASIYIEPGRENEYKTLIPATIRESNIIAGDLNNTNTPLEKVGVFHYKNMKYVKEIKLNRKILDHPIIITEIMMNTLKLNQKRQVIIINKITAKNNM